jgi:hypothetical protein
MSFLSILEKLKAQKDILKTEVLPGDPTARTKAGMINQAKFQIEQLKEDFRDEALRRSVVILVFGPRAAQTVKILNEDFDVKSSSPRALSSKVVDKIDKSLYDNKQLHPSVIDTATSVLDDIARDIGISYLPTFYYDGAKHAVQLTKREDLERVVEKAILDKVGGEIFLVNAVMSSIDELIDQEYNQPVLPIAMEVDPDDVAKLAEDLKRLTPNVFTMNVGAGNTKADLKLTSKQKLDKGVVEKALIQIKENLK